jgi:hypothetical protein
VAPTVVRELGHRPGAEGQPEILWPGQCDLDQLPKVLCTQDCRPTIRVRRLLEIGEAGLIETIDPLIHRRPFTPQETGHFRGIVPPKESIDDPIPVQDIGAESPISELLVQEPPFRALGPTYSEL